MLLRWNRVGSENVKKKIRFEVDGAPDAPYIDSFTVADLVEDFRSSITGTPRDRGEDLVFRAEMPCDAKISDDECVGIGLAIKEVLWLEVTVYNVMLVQIFDAFLERSTRCEH
jgi:hypothetical protein